MALRLLTALLVGVPGVGCVGREGPDRIILIVADTLRRDYLSPYGSEEATPNLQRLADEGSVFSNAIASFHQTTMSMSSLFTGRTPSLETGDANTILPWTSRGWCGMARFAESDEDSCIPQKLDTLAESLQQAGYETIGIQSNWFIFRPYGYEQGFDTRIEGGEGERPKTELTRQQQTYRQGRWKSTWARNRGPMALFDLQEDPGKKRDVAGSHPEIVQQHRDRIAALTQSLAASVSESEMQADRTADEEARLRALGYLG